MTAPIYLDGRRHVIPILEKVVFGRDRDGLSCGHAFDRH